MRGRERKPKPVRCDEQYRSGEKYFVQLFIPPRIYNDEDDREHIGDAIEPERPVRVGQLKREPSDRRREKIHHGQQHQSFVIRSVATIVNRTREQYPENNDVEKRNDKKL